MVTSHRSLVFLLLFIVGYHLSDGKSRYGRYQNYDKKCQLRLYAVPEFRVSNDIIDSDMRVRRQRRNDKSLSTIGKDDLKSFSLWKNLKGGNEGRGNEIYIHKYLNCLYLWSKLENIFSGNCCWKLYTRRYFRGRKTIVAGNIEVRTLRRLGRGNRKIRSVKQYESCEDML